MDCLQAFAGDIEAFMLFLLICHLRLLAEGGSFAEERRHPGLWETFLEGILCWTKIPLTCRCPGDSRCSTRTEVSRARDLATQFWFGYCPPSAQAGCRSRLPFSPTPTTFFLVRRQVSRHSFIFFFFFHCTLCSRFFCVSFSSLCRCVRIIA